MILKAKIMEPKKKTTDSDREVVDVTAAELETENKRISQRIIASEPHIPDVTGLHADTTVVSHPFDNEEI
jgi:hypothetical protein